MNYAKSSLWGKNSLGVTYEIIISSLIAVVITTLSSLALSNTLSADRGDVSDVLAVIHKWAELEDDLEAQAELIRDDRVQVGGGVRQSNQAENLAVQLLRYNALVDLWGGEPDLMVSEDPLVQIYGNVAVVSFMRLLMSRHRATATRPVLLGFDGPG